MISQGNWNTTRSLQPAISGLGVQRPPEVNTNGDLIVSQFLPERAQLSAAGRGYCSQIAAASAFTLLITIPTTRAELALQNSAAPGGKSIIIDRVWIKTVTSIASAAALTILANIAPPGTAIVAQAAGAINGNLSGRGNITPTYDGVGVTAIASTITGALTDRWQPIGLGGATSATTNIGLFAEAFCYGRYIIPPGAVFNMNAQESVSGGTAILGVDWYEVVLPIVA